MKGFIQLSAIAAIACIGASASAQNLIHNGDFENSSNHPSLSGWLGLGLVAAKKSTFADVTDAAYIAFIGSVSQIVSLTAGQEYDLSGEAALFGLTGDKISVIDGSHNALTELNVPGHFSDDFTVTHTGNYSVSFGSLGLGGGEISDLSLTNVQSTPEPCSIVALGVGIAGVIRARRKR